MTKKTPLKKARLAHAQGTNRRIPVFVVAKTNRKVMQNRERRNWRTQKLRLTDDD